MEKTKIKIKNYWNERSSTFDDSPGHTISSKEERKEWKILLKNKLGKGTSRVLDVGTGTGFLSLMLADMGYDVVGIDLSEEMIEKARKKANNRNLDIDFKNGDGEDLPFEKSSFDAVVNRAVLWTLPHPEKAVKEWKRVLKPKGILCFFLSNPERNGISYRLKRSIQNLFVLLTEKRNAFNSLYWADRSKLELPFRGGVEPEVIENLLKRSGLKEVSSEPLKRLQDLCEKEKPFYRKITPSYLQYCYSASPSNSKESG